MSDETWRLGHGRDPMREAIRRDMPNSRDGVVFTDIDLAVRHFGPNYGLDSDGDLMVIECKTRGARLTKGKGQDRVLCMLDEGMSTGQWGHRWLGVHLLSIEYQSEPRICETCEQPIESADEAYARFRNATLRWDGVEITYSEFLKIMSRCPDMLAACRDI